MLENQSVSSLNSYLFLKKSRAVSALLEGGDDTALMRRKRLESSV